MEYILTTHNLTKKYQKFKAVDNASLHLKKGAIYGLIGKNGAGKTTLLRLISGLINPTGGSYELFGISNNNKKMSNTRKRIGALIETPMLISSLTAKENLIEAYKIIGLSNYDDIPELLKLVHLNNETKKVSNFSLGMKERLAIAMSFVSHPDFLILDEPINGLDPEGIIDIRELIITLNQKYGVTILISSHYLDELSKIATHYGFIEKGHIIKEISREELTKNLNQKLELKVNNIKEAVKYCEINNISYEVINNEKLNIYNKNDISKIILDLNKVNCNVLEIHEKKETLENYFINLIGGDNYD